MTELKKIGQAGEEVRQQEQRHQKERQAALERYWDKPVDREALEHFAREHFNVMCGLMGIGHTFDKLSLKVVWTPEEVEAGGDEDLEHLRLLPSSRMPAGMASVDDYGRGTIWVFAWQIKDHWALTEIVLHEIAHLAALRLTRLLSGTNRVTSFVNEQIIIPVLSAVWYNPATKTLEARREVDPADPQGTRKKPSAPRRYQ